MRCKECTATQSIRSRPATLVVGTVPNNSTALYVYIARDSDRLTYRYTVTSSAGGQISIDLSGDQNRFTPNHCYTVWATLASATDIDDKLQITIPDGASTSAANCWRIYFVDTYDEDGALITGGSQTLEKEQ